MTIDEAKKIIKSECYIADLLNLDRTRMVNTALDLAIKALEQQPCEDCISRKDLLEKFTEECTSECACCMYVRDGYSCGLIEDAPYVTPQRPKGKWKPLNYKDEMWGYVYKCSNCGHIDYGNDYCPKCGARMESDSE